MMDRLLVLVRRVFYTFGIQNWTRWMREQRKGFTKLIDEGVFLGRDLRRCIVELKVAVGVVLLLPAQRQDALQNLVQEPPVLPIYFKV